MDRPFCKSLRKLLMGRAAVYAGFMALAMSILVIWANILSEEDSLAGPFSYLAGAQTVMMPVYFLGAFRKGADKAQTGKVYMTGCLAACAPLTVITGLVLPRSDSWAALAGFVFWGGAMAGICLIVFCAIRNRWAAAVVSVIVFLMIELIPFAAECLDGTQTGATVARILLYLAPGARMNVFLNGILDLGAAVYMGGLCGAGLYVCGHPGKKRLLRAGALTAFVAVCLAFQPAVFTQVDMTPAHVTELSDEAALVLRGLNLPVTVYQVAPAGDEDPWIRSYLQKLSERHKMVSFRPVSPCELEALEEMNLTENSLVVEQDEQWIVLRNENFYQWYTDAVGTRAVFALEGALIRALDEATGSVMSEAAVIPGRQLETTYKMGKEARSDLALGMTLGSILLLALGVVGSFLRRKHER